MLVYAWRGIASVSVRDRYIGASTEGASGKVRLKLAKVLVAADVGPVSYSLRICHARLSKLLPEGFTKLRRPAGQ